MPGIAQGLISTYRELITVEYVVVAGGGSGSTYTGGDAGPGGGGAGGVRFSTSIKGSISGGPQSSSSLSLYLHTPYDIKVGHGGAGVTNGANGNTGGNSVFHTITALGGGGGGIFRTAGLAGGCGGGAGAALADQATPIYEHAGGAASSPVQGYAGGKSINANNATSYSTYYKTSGGGGGGAGGAGGDSSGTYYQTAGNGGAGLTFSSVTAFPVTSSITLAGGGGGAAQQTHPTYSVNGSGGSGIGGAGSSVWTPESGRAGAGTAHTGSGGGAQNLIVNGTTPSTGRGGSGVVYITYPNDYKAVLKSTSNLTLTSVAVTAGAKYKIAKITLVDATATAQGTGTITFGPVNANFTVSGDEEV